MHSSADLDKVQLPFAGEEELEDRERPLYGAHVVAIRGSGVRGLASRHHESEERGFHYVK
jgi:hypothetical protein